MASPYEHKRDRELARAIREELSRDIQKIEVEVRAANQDANANHADAMWLQSLSPAAREAEMQRREAAAQRRAVSAEFIREQNAADALVRAEIFSRRYEPLKFWRWIGLIFLGGAGAAFPGQFQYSNPGLWQILVWAAPVGLGAVGFVGGLFLDRSIAMGRLVAKRMRYLDAQERKQREDQAVASLLD